jgi:hypothetical protein
MTQIIAVVAAASSTDITTNSIVLRQDICSLSLGPRARPTMSKIRHSQFHSQGAKISIGAGISYTGGTIQAATPTPIISPSANTAVPIITRAGDTARRLLLNDGTYSS